jgi:translation initiation factor IF-2
MGHVDHGKTSLLDALRATDVVSREAGGITQHIGAYQVVLDNGAKITFIDTPGHAAFTEMRARGANTTDIVIWSWPPTTGSCPRRSRPSATPRRPMFRSSSPSTSATCPNADPTRVPQRAAAARDRRREHGRRRAVGGGLGQGREGLVELTDAVMLQAEILELKANADRSAEGSVIEAKLERGRGAVATVLVQRGTLRVGDIFVSGGEWGRVRALVDDRGEPAEAAGPAQPIEVLGLNGVPLAGDDFVVVDSEARAREITEYRNRRKREASQVANARGTLEQMFDRIQSGEVKQFPIIIKGDVQGSVEAIAGSLAKLVDDSTEVEVRVLHAGVGGINESDITLAIASQAMIIGFNVRANPQARELARRDNLDIHYYSVIYDIIDDVRKIVSGMLSPTVRENFLGNAEIREVFNITKVGKVAGCYVTEGVVRRGASVRLLRDNVVIHQGNLKTLKRFKEEVREVMHGYECGMAFIRSGSQGRHR